MKKLIAFALVIVMCLAITSCGASEKEELYDKYEKLIDALEDKDFEKAFTQIQLLYQATEGKDEGDDEEEEPSPEVEAMKARAYGEWTPSLYATEEYGLTAVTINKDGTAKFGDKNYTWEFAYAYESSLDMVLKDGDTEAYKAYVYLEDDGSTYMSFSRVDGENSSSHIGNLYNLDEYTKIELTADNIYDYFEEKEKVSFDKDAFGEITSMDVYKYLVLKDEFGTVCDDISNVAVEYSYKEIEAKVTADKTTGEYHIGEVTYDSSDSDPYTNTTTMGELWWDDDVRPYGMQVGSFYVDEFPVDTVWGIDTEFAIIRLAGTIYTYTPAE